MYLSIFLDMSTTTRLRGKDGKVIATKRALQEVLQTFTTLAVSQKFTEEIKSFGHLHNLFTKSEETAGLVVFTGFNLAFLIPAHFLTER